MHSLPLIIQVRKDCLIAYSDFSVTEKNTKKTERKPIKAQEKFSASAKKRMKKNIDLWEFYRQKNTKISFITLTYSSQISNNKKIEIDLKIWLEKMLYRYGKFNYVWKLELQKNGNPHFHLIIDKETDWRIVRGIWNKTQKEEVDKYQMKMKSKYKNGYHFDENLLNKKGEIIDKETQLRRYKIGYRANWRNPNSTDVKIINTAEENINSYINKYVNKTEENAGETNNIKQKRWFGCNDEIKQLRFPTLKENEITDEEMKEIFDKKIKDITDEKYNIICSIHEKINLKTVENKIQNIIKSNTDSISYNSTPKINLLQKERKKYENLFEISENKN